MVPNTRNKTKHALGKKDSFIRKQRVLPCSIVCSLVLFPAKKPRICCFGSYLLQKVVWVNRAHPQRERHLFLGGEDDFEAQPRNHTCCQHPKNNRIAFCFNTLMKLCVFQVHASSNMHVHTQQMVHSNITSKQVSTM